MGTMSCIDHSQPTKVEVGAVKSSPAIDQKLLEHVCLRLTDISDALEHMRESASHVERIDDLINAISMHETPDLDGVCKDIEGLNATVSKAAEAIVKAVGGLKLSLQLPSTDTKIEVASSPVTIEVPKFLYLATSLPFFYLVIFHLAQRFLHF